MYKSVVLPALALCIGCAEDKGSPQASPDATWSMTVPGAVALQTADWDGMAGDELVVLFDDGTIEIYDTQSRLVDALELPDTDTHRASMAMGEDGSGPLLTIRQSDDVDTFDAHGTQLFSVSNESHGTEYTDAAWGDVDGDGVEELYIAQENGVGGGILAYSATGELLDGMGTGAGWVDEMRNDDMSLHGVDWLDVLPATADQPGVLLGASLFEPFVIDSELSEVSWLLPEHSDGTRVVGASLPIRGPDGQPMWALSVDGQLEIYDSEDPTTPVWSTDAMSENFQLFLLTRSSAWLSRGSWDGSPVIAHLVEDGFAVVDIHGTQLAHYALGGDTIWNAWEDHGPHSFLGMGFVGKDAGIVDPTSQEQGLAVLRDGRLEYFER